MSDCTIAAQVLEKREEPAEYLVDRMIRICRDQLMLPIRQTMERIDCHEICFMESRGHNVYIYTKNREIRIYQKLTDLVDLLPDYFHQCHKSYIVNLEYVLDELDAENEGLLKDVINLKDDLKEKDKELDLAKQYNDIATN